MDKKKKIKTSNIALIVVAITLILFTITNIVLFIKFQMIPDTLVTVFFSACLSEFGFLAWIRTAKSKYGDTGDDEPDDEIEEGE